LPFGISPLRSEIPPATSLIPKPLCEIIKNSFAPFGVDKSGQIYFYFSA